MLEHNPGAKHGIVKLRVLDLTANQRVEWQCISRHPPHSPASAWTGTHFIFEISERDSAASTIERACDSSGAAAKRITTLDFRQTNYDDRSEYAGFNNFAWGQVLNNLKRVCESQSR